MKGRFLPLIAAFVAAIALMLPQDAWPQKPEAMRLIGILGHRQAARAGRSAASPERVLSGSSSRPWPSTATW